MMVWRRDVGNSQRVLSKYALAKIELFGSTQERIRVLVDYRKPCEICGKPIQGSLHPRQKYCKSCKKTARNEHERAVRRGRHVMEERLEAFKPVFLARFQ